MSSIWKYLIGLNLFGKILMLRGLAWEIDPDFKGLVKLLIQDGTRENLKRFENSRSIWN